jgi:isocitrate dehydrogenase
MEEYKRITVAFGDGIGPEIMDATLSILKEAKARITIDTIEVGKLMYERGFSSGIPPEAWQSIQTNKILFKSPITTPQGGGYKSLNVTMRKMLGLYANVRPCSSYAPFIATKHPELDVVIVRENEEDLYAGIEYRQSHNVYQSLKLITRTGSEKIIRYAFEYAVKNNRKKVTCFSKDNIMKFTDGLFHKIFDEVAKEYQNIEVDHYIIDIGTARLASKPQIFDVIVTSNLYGDIISDVVAEISGSVGLAGSANIGEEFALFEAIHGSAPDIAGKNIANPSGLINAAIMMLVHIGQGEIASKIQNAWLKTIEDGMHTIDIFNDSTSIKQLGTKEFAQEVIARLGEKPTKFKVANYANAQATSTGRVYEINTSEVKTLVGVDVVVNSNQERPMLLAEEIIKLTDKSALGLQLISVKGLKAWPEVGDILIKSDEWSLRFVATSQEKIINHAAIVSLLEKLSKANFDFVRTNNLYLFDNKLGFSLVQGE